MVHDKVNILADKRHTQIDVAKAKEKMEYISMAHIKVCNIINLSPDWFHDDYELQVASLFYCCYWMCRMQKIQKIWQSIRLRIHLSSIGRWGPQSFSSTESVSTLFLFLGRHYEYGQTLPIPMYKNESRCLLKQLLTIRHREVVK